MLGLSPLCSAPMLGLTAFGFPASGSFPPFSMVLEPCALQTLLPSCGGFSGMVYCWGAKDPSDLVTLAMDWGPVTGGAALISATGLTAYAVGSAPSVTGVPGLTFGASQVSGTYLYFQAGSGVAGTSYVVQATAEDANNQVRTRGAVLAVSYLGQNACGCVECG